MFFYVGREGKPNAGGYRVAYPKGATDEPIGRAFMGEDVVVELQNGWKTSELK